MVFHKETIFQTHLKHKNFTTTSIALSFRKKIRFSKRKLFNNVCCWRNTIDHVIRTHKCVVHFSKCVYVLRSNRCNSVNIYNLMTSQYTIYMCSVSCTMHMQLYFCVNIMNPWHRTIAMEIEWTNAQSDWLQGRQEFNFTKWCVYSVYILYTTSKRWHWHWSVQFALVQRFFKCFTSKSG